MTSTATSIGGVGYPIAVPYEALALSQPLRFSPPMIQEARDPDAFVFWSHVIQHSFDLNDPATVPPLPDPLTSDEVRIVRRYVQKAQTLARTRVMNFDAFLKVRTNRDGTFSVDFDLPPEEANISFTVTFRQFYANDEGASFNVVQGILMKAARAATDQGAASRVDELVRWGKAVGLSRSRNVRKSLLQALVERGDYVATASELAPDPDNPEQLFRTHFYGDKIHWDPKSGQATALEARTQSAADQIQYEYDYLLAAIGLAHLYVGYAVLAGQLASL